ncbi:MAG TPA: hypothetical protein VKP00_14530, partial [Gemmatimonadaceae bacterium]|nr:hypothetical protein [Gemmatimonadaceae bacterium]
MPSFFPNQTIEFKLEEPRAFRRFSFSLVEMAIVTGVLVRVVRLVALTHGSNNWFYLGGVLAIGAIFLLGMLTAHLANYPLQEYLWRAPLFALIEVTAEMATSALLIAVGREANGTVRAHWDDWLGMSLNALLYRGLAIVVWGLILAGVVQLVRRTILHEDD